MEEYKDIDVPEFMKKNRKVNNKKRMNNLLRTIGEFILTLLVIISIFAIIAIIELM